MSDEEADLADVSYVPPKVHQHIILLSSKHIRLGSNNRLFKR